MTTTHILKRKRKSVMDHSLMVRLPIVQSPPSHDGTAPIHERIDLMSILKILYALDQDMSFSRLYRKSSIMHGKSFCRYVRFCIDSGLLIKYKSGKQSMSYHITEKGRDLLSMFMR